MISQRSLHLQSLEMHMLSIFLSFFLSLSLSLSLSQALHIMQTATWLF